MRAPASYPTADPRGPGARQGPRDRLREETASRIQGRRSLGRYAGRGGAGSLGGRRGPGAGRFERGLRGLRRGP